MENIKEYVKNKKENIKNFINENNIKLCLGIVQVNKDPASNAYIKGKIKDCIECGIEYKLFELDETISEDELLSFIDKLNNDDSISGFIVQMPLPKHIDEEKVKQRVIKEKDVDGFNPLSKFAPATPKGILTYLEDNDFEFNGKNAVVLGRSNIVGKPMHDLLLAKNMNVTVLHSKTTEEDKKFYIEHADLIVVAIGKKYFLDNRYSYKENCIVMDVGINRDVDNHLYGDCIPDLKVKFVSPVPGGVGLLTRLALTLNLLDTLKK